MHSFSSLVCAVVCCVGKHYTLINFLQDELSDWDGIASESDRTERGIVTDEVVTYESGGTTISDRQRYYRVKHDYHYRAR